ncbi:MAG: phosphoribosylanthranilate isomerase [Gammaproteobacteria bacterium]|nr:phosphoribosylanthranilate isomerase [Gammaproteobacteria bacterium]
MTSSVRIKICGLRSPEQALAAVAAGAHAIGLNFYAGSPRVVEPAMAREICEALPPFVTTVGLFVDAPAGFVASVLDAVPLQLLQFHGDEGEAFCRQWRRPYLKALRMREDLDTQAALQAHAGATGILLDGYRPGVPGGTGEVFDWDRIPQQRPRPIVLAGGLTAANVGEAIRRVRPWAVDVSGGVEREPGVKDPAAMEAFVRAVRAAETGVKD